MPSTWCPELGALELVSWTWCPELGALNLVLALLALLALLTLLALLALLRLSARHAGYDAKQRFLRRPGVLPNDIASRLVIESVSLRFPLSDFRATFQRLSSRLPTNFQRLFVDCPATVRPSSGACLAFPYPSR